MLEVRADIYKDDERIVLNLRTTGVISSYIYPRADGPRYFVSHPACPVCSY